ncbi:MAG: hypothetical protein JO304_04895 [Solirubrobacterales bacterium]|nr:hypothetical protein [Solirubrobacterales bacterium]
MQPFTGIAVDESILEEVATMSPSPRDVSWAVEAYAAYLNTPRGILDSEQQLLFDEDMARARAAMERAWLESTPVREVTAD